MTLRITSIQAYPYPLELGSTLAWGKGHTLKTLHHVFVTVELDNGAIGIAEATPRPTIYGETPESICAIIEREISDIALGLSIDSLADIHALDRQLGIIKNNNTAKGAFNIALWSAFAQAHDGDLAELLEISQQQVFLSYILGTGGTDDLLKQVDSLFQRGIRCLKVKVGKDFSAEWELINNIRATYGEQMRMYVDANQCYQLEEAQRLLRQFAEAGIEYCEEPLPVYAIADRSSLRSENILPIIADDSCFTIHDLERELAFNTFDILNIKMARTGYSQSSDMLQMAQSAGKEIMIGSQASSILGCLHAILFSAQNGIDCPAEGSFFLNVRHELSELLQISEGKVNLSEVLNVLPEVEETMLKLVKKRG